MLETSFASIVGGYHPKLYGPKTVFVPFVYNCVIANFFNLQQLPVSAKISIIVGFLA
jgi:hypothetical protein